MWQTARRSRARWPKPSAVGSRKRPRQHRRSRPRSSAGATASTDDQESLIMEFTSLANAERGRQQEMMQEQQAEMMQEQQAEDQRG